MEKKQLILENRQSDENPKVLRKQGSIPCVIYSHGKTQHFKIETKSLIRLFLDGVTESTILDIKVDGKVIPAYIKEYQRHPVTDDFLHVDFFQITKGEKIKTNIALEFIGEAVGLKQGGVLETFIYELALETLPQNLGESLEVDISGLDIGDAIHIKDLELPADSKILIEGNPIVCSLSKIAKMSSEDDATGLSPDEKSETAQEKSEEK